MTGRNHTTNGMATITDAASGYPSSNGHIPFECATIAEVLGEPGGTPTSVGKWHLTAEDEMNLASRTIGRRCRRGQRSPGGSGVCTR
jgi:arylsulfatase A-like enzyme